MQIVQECIQHLLPREIPVQSQTNPGILYAVLLLDGDVICECTSYKFRGHCKHQNIALALDAECLWQEIIGPEEQSDHERKERLCPRCGGFTEDVLEPIE